MEVSSLGSRYPGWEDAYHCFGLQMEVLSVAIGKNIHLSIWGEFVEWFIAVLVRFDVKDIDRNW